MRLLITSLLSFLLAIGQGPILSGIMNVQPAATTSYTFTHVRGAHGANSGTSGTVNMTTAPTTGYVVMGCALFNVAVTGVAVSDTNSNTYTISSGSPSTFESGAGQTWCFYLLSAPSNATATLDISWTTTANADFWADQFSKSGGTVSFDKDAKTTTNPTAGTVINLPSITPTNTGELLYACASAGGTISSPTAGATYGTPTWTGSGGAISDGDMCEYILSSTTSATIVQFAQSSGNWSAMSEAVYAH